MSQVLVTILIALGASIGSVFLFSLKSRGKKDGESENLEKEEVVVKQKKSQKTSQSADEKALLAEAKAKAKEIVLDAKDEAMKLTQQAQKESAGLKNKLIEKEQAISVKSAEIKSKKSQVEKEEKSLDSIKKNLENKQKELKNLINKEQEKLQKVANLSEKEAKERLLKSFEKEIKQEKGKRLKEMKDEIEKEADEKAREILVYAMKQGATDYVVEHSSSKVKLPDEDMKGRIIGKEGRNIHKFEELTGVELELDASPGEVIVSSFDPVRREIAKVSLEKLIKDGRIQPAMIESVVKKTEEEIDKIVYKEGDNLCHRLGVYDLPKEVVQALGKFKYRFSYGQNMIEHTLEVAKMGMAIASEINADVEIVKLGCLLHDIGKVLEGEGSHVELGIGFLKKHNIKQEVIDCVEQHHEDKPFTSTESAITHVADHVSGARPSARSEDYDSYVKRLKALEDVAYSFNGVEKVYAISAGREVRVFVEPDKVDDDSAELLAREIARKIELEQTYPGVVKVTVIRETRVTQTAK